MPEACRGGGLISIHLAPISLTVAKIRGFHDTQVLEHAAHIRAEG